MGRYDQLRPAMSDKEFEHALFETEMSMTELRNLMSPPTHKLVAKVLCGCGVMVDVEQLGIRDDGNLEHVLASLRKQWARNQERHGSCGHEVPASLT